MSNHRNNTASQNNPPSGSVEISIIYVHKPRISVTLINGQAVKVPRHRNILRPRAWSLHISF